MPSQHRRALIVERTPEQWLELLTKQADKAKIRTRRLAAYCKGRAPLPNLSGPLRESWEEFQAKSRLNLGGLIIQSLADRIQPRGITVAGAADHPAALEARGIWQENRLDANVADAVVDSLTTGVGYLMCGVDNETGRALVTRQSPRQFYAMADPVKPWRSRAAIDVWRDIFAGQDYARVMIQGASWLFTRPARNTFGSLEPNYYGSDFRRWTRVADPANPAGTAQGTDNLVLLTNRDGIGEIEEHTDTLDRINWSILQRLVVTALQSFKQRALATTADPTTGEDPLPDEDEEGNVIDYTRIFAPGPGGLWKLPPGVSIWESGSADLTPILMSVREDVKLLSAATQTPMTSLISEGANQTAQGAELQAAGLTSKAEDRINRFRPALNVLMQKALQLEGTTLDARADELEVQFEPPAIVSLSEKYAAAAQARAAGVSIETVQRRILGFSPQEVTQDAALRAAAEMTAQLTIMPQAAPNAQS